MGAPGCDDAPIVTVPIGIEPRKFTLIMPYYENPNFLAAQIMHWQGRLPDDLTRYMSIMIVDDGSPNRKAQDVFKTYWPIDSSISLSQFRIEVDVRWNWLAARNIGVHNSKTDWIMLTDMDHVLPENTLNTLVYGQHSRGVIYRFSRTGAKTHPHPNSWFMTKNMYWQVGGYDETFSGYYGTDGEYRRRCAATAPIRIMDVPLELHEHENDASTTHYLRKQPEDARVKQLIKMRKPGWKPKVLSFPYHEVRL